MKVLYFIVFVAAAYAGPVPQDVEEAQMEAEPQTPNVFPHFREQENPLKALETLREILGQQAQSFPQFQPRAFEDPRDDPIFGTSINQSPMFEAAITQMLGSLPALLGGLTNQTASLLPLPDLTALLTPPPLPDLSVLTSLLNFPALPNLLPNITIPFLTGNSTAASASTNSYEIREINGTLFAVNTTSVSTNIGDTGGVVFYNMTVILPVQLNTSIDDESLISDDPMPKSNDPIKIVQKSESQKDAKTNLLVRKKRWSFDDLIEVLLRMKYGLFFHQNVTEITDNSIDDQPSSVISRAEVTTSVPSYSDVADQFGAENLVSEFGEYRMRPENGVEYDLESDTRVNYVRGYHRNELDNNDEVEVFDWDLVSEDAEKNSGNPYGRAEELKESAKISDDTKNGFLVSEGIRRISEVPNQRSSSLRMVRPAPYVNPVVGSIPSIPPPIAGENAVFYFKSNSGPAPYAYQSGLPTSYNNDDVEIL